MMFINLNGRILPDNSSVIDYHNSAFRYGDGIFETIKLKAGRLLWIDDHLYRLFSAIRLLGYELPSYFSKNFLIRETQHLCATNRLQHARIRISVYRKCTGLFDEEENTPIFLIEANPLNPEDTIEFKNLGLYSEEIKTAGNLSRYKLTTALPYRVAALYANKMQWDDALLVNQYNRICDSCIANVFFVNNNIITTPPISEGCVDGIYRKHLLQTSTQLGFQITESAVPLAFADTADEIFLTNVIRGIMPVRTYHERPLSTSFTERLIKAVTPFFNNKDNP